ncbi:MAG: response regulator [Prevotellaceae bacterium]|jgi:signal transduction histidine kinase/DNA-binding response OmpR family regulator|nr:response regulator [Prevotellaceae bacterium]
MRHDELKTKIIVLTGYILLIILLLVGIVGITYQIQRMSKINKNNNESQNLITVSYVLATLYSAESIGSLVYVSNLEIDYALLARKDSLMSVVKNGISELKRHTDNKDFIEKLDTVEILLSQKTDNELKIIQLLNTIMKLPLQQRQITTILSKKELAHLATVIKNRDSRLMDSTRVVVRQKSFGEKFGDLFRSQTKDSLFLQTVQNTEIDEEIVPLSVTLDTISQFVTDFIYERNRKSFKMAAMLSMQQIELQSTNETLFGKINIILRNLEEREFFTKEQLIREQNATLFNSNKIGNIVTLAALIISISVIVITMRLINRQRDYRRQLEKQNAQIERLLKSREWMMLSISHDIKAPISSIMGYTDLLSTNNKTDSEQNYITNMKNSSLQVLELVNNLLNFHKIEQGKLEAKLSEFIPYQHANEVFMMFKSVARTKKLDFTINNHIPENLQCKSDITFINQIVNNLISNALKFTEEGEINLETKLEQTNGKKELVFSIRDTGIGISPEDLHRLFNEFERIQSSEVQHIEGSGLGLSISHKLATLLDGQITVQSEKGKGSTFRLTIPALDVKMLGGSSQNAVNQRNTKQKLLFVDDDLLMLKVYEEMTKKTGYDPYTTDKANQIVNILENNDIDIVFCDIKMPEINGFALVETVKQNVKSPPPIVALSAVSPCSDSELKAGGFVDFLQKPFDIIELNNIVNKLTGKPQDLKNKDAESKTPEKRANFTSLLNYALGDHKASEMILRTFISENVNIACKIQTAIDNADNARLKELAHKLLPRMKMINNQEIVKILHALERGETKVAQQYNLTQLIKEVNAEAIEFIKNELK